jgi:hypothetical protein
MDRANQFETQVEMVGKRRPPESVLKAQKSIEEPKLALMLKASESYS